MAKSFRRQGGGNAGSKIVSVNSAQGVKGIGKMQGTTRILFDSVKLATTTTNTTVTLFQGCNTRDFPLTNLTENKLQVGESIAMQRFSVYIISCSTGTLNAQGVYPLAYFGAYSRIYNGLMSFNIAENQVIKNLPLAALYAPLNHQSKFFGNFTIQVLAADPITQFAVPHDTFKFDNDIIIPPQIQFFTTITLPPITVVPGFDSYLAMKISGLGSLYAPKANY
jgi:hypothetical protein